MPSIPQPDSTIKLPTNGNVYMNGDVASKAKSNVRGYQESDNFQHLPRPQQDVLLLHGPRQKYSLQTTGQIPALRSDREILVQVGSYFRNSNDSLRTTGGSDWFEPRRLERAVSKAMETDRFFRSW